MRNNPALLALAVLVMLAGCSSEPEKSPSEGGAKPAAKPTVAANEYETGRVAFQKAYINARGWAADAKPFRLESQYTKDAPGALGKAGVWRAVFASTQRSSSKAFAWSGVTGPDAPAPGVASDAEGYWSPSNANTQPFDLNFLKQDSDKAVAVAQAHGGEKLTKKDPAQPIIFQLDWSPKESKLKWHVIYGTSLSDAKLRVAVDATTGEFLKVEK
ncbi:MAG: hypothetical protein M3P27_01360 [Acidobacteriota bacterium]|nr:hypothetical protein [Acidobacteriota bacterium]